MTDAELPNRLKNAPNMVWELPPGSSIGQLPAADLDGYLQHLQHLAQSISVLSNTPFHRFLPQGGVPSGESLKVLEAPLVKRVQDRQDVFTPTWKRLLWFLLRLAGVEDVQVRDVQITWREAATSQPGAEISSRATHINAALSLVQLGVSPQQALRELGYTDAQIARFQQEREAAAPALAAPAADEAPEDEA
jgi:hypothetical protein